MKRSRIRPGRDFTGPFLCLGLLFSACGDDMATEVPRATAVQVQEFWGLTPGSCIRYRFTQMGVGLFAEAQVNGPETTPVPGRSVLTRSFSRLSGGLADSWFIDAQDDGELRLLRFDTSDDQGMRLSTRYACIGDDVCPAPDEQEPLLLQVELTADGAFDLNVGQRFETVTTPPFVSPMSITPEPELHRVQIQSVSEDIPVPPREGTATEQGYVFLYRQAIGTNPPRTTTLRVVPGKGIAQLQESNGPIFQACDWRYCDAAGNCQGADSCANLTCN